MNFPMKNMFLPKKNFMRRDLLHKNQYYVFFLAKNRVVKFNFRFDLGQIFQTVCLVSTNIDGEIETYISYVSVCILVYMAQYTDP